MKILKYLFGTAGGVLILVAFFLPWVYFNQSAQVISGFYLTPFRDEVPFIELSFATGDGWLWVIFGTGVVALLALVFASLKLEKAQVAAGIILVTCSVVGFAFIYLRADAFLRAMQSSSSVILAARSLFQGFALSNDGSTLTTSGVFSAGIGLYLLLTGELLVLLSGIFSFAPTTNRQVATTQFTEADRIYPSPAMTPSPFPVQDSQDNNEDAPKRIGRKTIPDGARTIADSLPDIESEYQKRKDSNPVYERPANPNTIADIQKPETSTSSIDSFGHTSQIDTGQTDQANTGTAFAWLIVRQVRGLKTGHSFTLSSDVFTIGRGEGNQLTLTDSSVSTKHAEIAQQGNRFFVRDLQSSNGTFVYNRMQDDWVQIDQIQLNDGDQIRFGRSVFSFVNIKN